ncbi:hypothetical protein I0C86_41020 [Plantactinospora sp. S1510]|uniref:Uncharacterized protein n=1 Tax=Plantactinospora alkalitolerans TaxID=2789879 RepID=A0ABS0HAQ2_9ACTN|nr:hypothetical protein [Plantactinospora alkalitolerans]MBF9135234.1 hypothetical protein [Plantactinospora alkalitolerans]
METQRRAKEPEIKRMRGSATKREPWLIRGQLAGLDVPPGDRVELAAVGWIEEDGPTVPPLAWGYLASSGHWGLGASPVPRRVGGDEVVGAEARGLFWGMRSLFPRERNPVTVITDFPEVADMVNAWRDGRTDVMPAGYMTQHPDSGRLPKLVILSRSVAQYPELIFVRLVEDYTDTRYGRGANTLARTAWDWSTRRIDREKAAADALAAAARRLDVPPVLLPPEHEQRRAEVD